MVLHSTDRVRWRRIPVAVLCTACAASVLCGTGLAEHKTKPVKESRRAETRDIEALEQQWRAAIVNGDVATMDKLLADDFLAISARGTLLDKEQYLNRMTTHATKLASVDLMDLKIRLQPRSAVAVSQAHISGLLEGKPIEGTFRYTKVYARTPSGVWHMTNFEATHVSRAGDGADADQAAPTGGSTPSTGDR